MNPRCNPLLLRLFLAFLALLALIWILTTPGCYNKQDLIEHVPASGPNERAWIIYNSVGLGKAHGLPECACGMRDDDFKRYVEERTKRKDVLKIKYEIRITLEGEDCLGNAVIYLK